MNSSLVSQRESRLRMEQKWSVVTQKEEIKKQILKIKQRNGYLEDLKNALDMNILL